MPTIVKNGNYFEEVIPMFKQYDNNLITKLPVRATANSAGYDFFTPIRFVVRPHSHSPAIFTNVKAHMYDDLVLMLYVRSSVGFKRGCVLSNGSGICDADYFSNPSNDGNIGFKLYNTSDEIQIFEAGERIIQGIFMQFFPAETGNVDTERVSGIGSTGV